MTDTTPVLAASTPNRPGADVIAAVALVFALVVGGAVALAVTGDDDATLVGAPGATSAPSEPGALPTNEPTDEPAPTGQPEPAATTPAAQPPGTQPPAAGACTYTPGGGASKDVGVPPATPLAVSGKTATIETTAGRITWTLSPSAPCTTSSFAFLADKGYFDNTPCHRLTTAGIFVLQCGDPTGQGTGGPGYAFADEALDGATYPAGTVAMANSGPGTNGSQFFLVYEDTQLPPSYTPWGRITGGLDVLTKVAAAGSDPEGDGAPKQQVTISRVMVR